MNKPYLHHLWTHRVRPVKVWYFLIPLVICGAVAVLALRNNYVTMTHLRSTVYTTDQNNGDVVAALQNLRTYVGSHMNTGLSTGDGVYPPIQLKYTYQRLQQAEQDRVSSVNSQVYTNAQTYCQQQNSTSFSGGARVPCIEQYVKDHGTTAQNISGDLYKFDFVSPTWSPDLAGWMVVVSVLLAFLAAVRLGIGWLLRTLSR